MSNKYYVHGCRIGDGGMERCEDSEAQSWTLYVRDEEGLSQGIIDCLFREDATAAMAVYVERDALQEQVRALAAENSIQDFIISAVKDLVSESEGVAGWHLNGDIASWDKALPELKHSETTATDTALREIRAQKAEAELARRDAAAGEAVILRPFGEDSQNAFVRCDEGHPFAVKLYTAAPPAVLPPEHETSFTSGEHLAFSQGYNQCRSDALELGAQQQKVVELPETYWTFDDDQNPTFDADKIIAALDAANVKWEVKK